MFSRKTRKLNLNKRKVKRAGRLVSGESAEVHTVVQRVTSWSHSSCN